MAKAKVITAFVDKFDNSIYYAVGSVVDFDDDRIADCAERGLVEVIKEAKPKAEASKKATKKTTKKES